MKEKIIDVKMSTLTEELFLEYGSYVIADRALPDVRDGLKPVQLKILWGMYEAGYLPDASFKKCARIVGDVMGKYHPHGDSSIYGALVFMEQPFAKRYPLISGHGNFGTTDDEPAAMRYTEAKLSPVSMYLLDGLKKNAVDFIDNYDGSEKEPVCLPAMIPNLLLNGTSGIAVGMSSEIPPHNLTEVLDATCAYIKNEKITSEELLTYVKGPDFPTGGIINTENIAEIYTTGKGSIKMRGEVNTETMKGSKKRIVITSIPFQTSKSKVLKKIAELVENDSLDFVTSIRDESSGETGLRIVIEVKNIINIKGFIEDLYKKTDLQKNYNFNMLALVDKKPVLLGLKDMIREFIKHRREVFRRITIFEKTKAENRLHILDGLMIAVQNIDEVIKIIRGSKNPKESKIKLVDRFNFTENQVIAILNLRLQGLTKLEITTLEKEIKSLNALIKKLKDLLNNSKKMDKEIIKDLEKIKKDFGEDKRITKISNF